MHRPLAILTLTLMQFAGAIRDAEQIRYRHHFNSRVLESAEPVLVVFLLNACKYCEQFKGIFNEVGEAFSANHSGFEYFKVRRVSEVYLLGPMRRSRASRRSVACGAPVDRDRMQVDHNTHPELGKKFDVHKFPEVLLFPANKERFR